MIADLDLGATFQVIEVGIAGPELIGLVEGILDVVNCLLSEAYIASK